MSIASVIAMHHTYSIIIIIIIVCTCILLLLLCLFQGLEIPYDSSKGNYLVSKWSKLNRL